MGLFIAGSSYANDSLIQQEIQNNPGLGTSSETSAALQEIADQLKSQLDGTNSKQARAREPRLKQTNDKSRLDAFLGATWRLDYTISSSFSKTIICQDTISIADSEGLILVCQTSDNLYSVGVSPVDTGGGHYRYCWQCSKRRISARPFV